jgi:alkaline phosphatase
MKKIILSLFVALFLFPGLFAQKGEQESKPPNVIILIGDGMGTAQLTIPYYYGKEEPVFGYFGNVGLVETSSATHKITDSAAGSTAMFTGFKTYNDAVGVDTDTLIRRNLKEILSERGYRSGVITTASITGATPAGFYAHVSHRTMHYDIADDLLTSGIDFFAGGGLKYFIRTDGKDAFADYNIEVSMDKLKKIRRPEPDTRYGFLLAMDNMPPMRNGRKDFLPKATEIALDYLSEYDESFLLMVEGAQIDGASHTNNTDYLVAEMLDFEETVRVAFEFAKKDGNTLLIVTSDHETGGFALGASGEKRYGEDYATITPSFATKTHSASLVPLLAYGPGAEKFRGILHNTEIFYRIIDVVMEER